MVHVLLLVELLTFLLFKLFNVNPNNQIKHLTLLLVQWGAVVAVIVWWLTLKIFFFTYVNNMQDMCR
jgi:uncharacterized BrkB/YihY/UPF0761 family membrane protein